MKQAPPLPDARLPLDQAMANWAHGPAIFVISGQCSEAEFNRDVHLHARGQILGSLGGLLSIGTENGVWVVPSIHAVWVPSNHPHSAQSHGPYRGWTVYVAPDVCSSLPPHPCTIRVSGLMREAILRASTWPLDFATPLEGANSRVAEVILDELRSLPTETFGLPLPKEPRLLRIARALIQDPSDERHLEQWATWGMVSSRTLSRRFVAETGFHFTAWRQRARLMRALELLADGQPVTSISIELGYSTPTAFINLFRRTFGATPAAYRERVLTEFPSATD